MMLVLEDYFPTSFLIHWAYNILFGVIFTRHFHPLVKQKYQYCKRTSATKTKTTLKLFFPVLFLIYSELMIVGATMSIILYLKAIFAD